MSEFIDDDGVVYAYAEVAAKRVVRGPYDGTRVRRGDVDYGVSRTSQSEAKESDLNWLVKRWTATGGLPAIAPASYGDVSESVSYVDVIQRLKRVSDDFMTLPASLREFFNNDAAVFADWVVDPANLAEGRELGLFPPEPAPEPVVPPVAPPA